MFSSDHAIDKILSERSEEKRKKMGSDQRNISYILKNLGYSIFKVDLDHDQMFFVDDMFQPSSDGGRDSWTQYLEKGDYEFCEECERMKNQLSIEKLLRTYETGLYSLNMEFIGCGVNLFFEKEENGVLYAYIAIQRADTNGILTKIVNTYVYNNCDYFIFLNGEKNSYVMFAGRDDVPLPPTYCEDYDAERIKYAQDFMIAEDQEMAIREMSLKRVIEKLKTQETHSFYVGVIDSERGYTRKKLEYRYYDKEKQFILLSCTDVTEIYLQEQKKNQELIEMRRRALTDSLTEILNNKTFEQNVSDVLKENLDSSALLFVDLDDFKMINDTYGHLVGDKVLKEVANILKRVTDKNDLVGRSGGDEFVVFLQKIHSKEDAMYIGKRICEEIAEMIRRMGIEQEGGASIGMAVAPEDGRNYEKLMKAADERLYRVKKSGKNGLGFS